MNVIHLIGNLGSDPKSVKNGEIAQVSLATSEKYTRKGETQPTVDTMWHTIFFYGKAAEIILQYAKKGKKLMVTGALKENKYTNAAGVEVKGYLIRAESFEFLDRLEKGENSENTDNVQESAPAQAAAVPANSKAPKAEAAKPAQKAVPAATTAKKPLTATVTTPVTTHTEEDLSFDESDPTEDDNLPF